MENRNPNTECKNCGKKIYKRPFEIEKFSNVFCSRTCRAKFDYNVESINCLVCKKLFKKRKTTQKYCSKKCSGKATRNRYPIKRVQKNWTLEKMAELRKENDFDTCMVEGCRYNRTFDLHRLIEGKNGGKYIIGNMFAICPNHHAEVHRKLIIFEKINNYTLRIKPMEG